MFFVVPENFVRVSLLVYDINMNAYPKKTNIYTYQVLKKGMAWSPTDGRIKNFIASRCDGAMQIWLLKSRCAF